MEKILVPSAPQNGILTGLHFLRLLAGQMLSAQRLGRTPEPHSLIERYEEVHQYNRVMSSRIVLVYAVLLELIHRARDTSVRGPALDLACGPGYLTLCLARHFAFEPVWGLDLSPVMLETASFNAQSMGLEERVKFRSQDITQLGDLASGSFAMTEFSNAAHHLPDLEEVSHVVREMDRITKPEGLVVVLDPVRLRTAEITDLYIRVIGRDYGQLGLPQFFESFANSMYAAWTAEELRSAIPRDSRRHWCHLVPFGLPATQILVGLPVGRRSLFLRGGFPGEGNLVPRGMRLEWQLLRHTLWWGHRSWVAPLRSS